MLLASLISFSLIVPTGGVLRQTQTMDFVADAISYEIETKMHRYTHTSFLVKNNVSIRMCMC